MHVEPSREPPRRCARGRWLLAMLLAGCAPAVETTDGLPDASGRPDAALALLDAASPLPDAAASVPDGSLEAAAAPGDAASPVAEAGPPRAALGWDAASIYLLLVDRFANGAPDPDPAEDECFDPANPRRFHGGDLAGLRARLGYLEELGVDTVWVTPLTRQIGRHHEQCGYHGYWADLTVPDDVALEPRLGTEADFSALLDDMHARGMRLVLDMVVNHPGYGAQVTRTHPEWFHPVAGCERLGPPDETCPLAWLPDFDQRVPEVADYLTEHSSSWIRRFDVDGIRMDTVKHVPLWFFRDRWIPAMRALRPDLYLVGELFDERPYEQQRAYLDAGFDGLFDFRLRSALVYGLGREGSLDRVAREVAAAWDSLGPERARRRSTLLDNHDVPRFASEIEQPEGRAVARLHLALGALLTTPGIPQLYSGTELGMAGGWPENRRSLPTWAFDAATRTPHEGFVGDPGETFALVRDLLALRRERAPLHRGDYVELWRPGGSGVPLYAFTRAVGDERVFVALTTGAVDQRIPLEDNPRIRRRFPDATLRDLLGRDDARAEIRGGSLHVVMPANGIAVFVLPEA
ncbi:MAG: alpha-amylase family glycosyl hydrolase [Deltaproteobacteria bacterium]